MAEISSTSTKKFSLPKTFTWKRLALIAGVFFVITFFIWAIPIGLALYYQNLAGSTLQQVVKEIDQDQSVTSYCYPPSLTDEQRLAVESARDELNRSLAVKPNYAQTNVLLGRVNCLMGYSDEAVEAYQRYTELKPDNPLGHIELALALSSDLNKKKSTAQTSLRKAGITSTDLMNVYSQYIEEKKLTPSIQWLNIIIYLDPENLAATSLLGRTCQLNFESFPEICNIFLVKNNNNWIVDSTFEQPLFDFWKPYQNTSKTSYGIEDCPGLAGEKCARVTVQASNPQQSGGLYQCLSVKPNSVYKFSSWINVDIAQGSKWRPLYFGGQIKEEPVGRWATQEFETQSTDWQYWEFVFKVREYDNQHLCFHPVRLDGDGSAWFYDVRLEKLEDVP